MKIKFKHQGFQKDAANVVCDVFAGQPYSQLNYRIDPGKIEDGKLSYGDDYIGFKNNPIVNSLTNEQILKNIQTIQRENQIKPSSKLEGKYNLTIEMETGVGKTYTYIKTIHELNKRYGWSKFIVVVPSVAIREGIYKSFQITQDHFAEDYGKKIRFFIYKSTNLTDIASFASDSAINVMIINSQAFNATGKDARRIDMKLDSFNSRRPIDVIAKTNPILIIDEPQRVEGPKTVEGLKKFNALFTLRYSATHRKYYNLIYRLDAMEAYNKKLVKKIAVKGISLSGTTATEGYVYVEKINIFKDKNPTASIGFDIKEKQGVKQRVRILSVRDNLYALSNELEEYKNGFIVSEINGADNSVTFQNGKKLYAGDYIGAIDEDQIRRIQIRETILSHIEKEKELFDKGIKVLSLFFIDEVAKYRQHGAENPNGIYAQMFEEEYENVVREYQKELFDDDSYINYLKSTIASPKDIKNAHDGYFSRDKKGNFIDPKKSERSESSDESAYDLIMKDKERLLDRKTPLRFIFSHSALREGWDNPNVFQICTLKQSSADISKRQEVGRGLRLCVNSEGERMDAEKLGEEVHKLNVLTIIASESYDSFAKGLQSELADVITDRPTKVDIKLFKGQTLKDSIGDEIPITEEKAQDIYDSLVKNGYVEKGILTDKYYQDKTSACIVIDKEVETLKDSIIELLDSIYDPEKLMPEDSRKNNISLKLNNKQFEREEFKKLWELIRPKSYYIVDFDSDELRRKAINSLNDNLHVISINVNIVHGEMDEIESSKQLKEGLAFKVNENISKSIDVHANDNVKYDLVGKITENTGLTRKLVVEILQGIEPSVFSQFKNNPEEFIIKASNLIDEQKATIIIQHIKYNRLDECFDESKIFTEPDFKGNVGNTIPTDKHIFDHVIFDSKIEESFAKDIDKRKDVAVYVKLPKSFYINTPVGKYNPDWAIAFEEDEIKHIYFIAETKGSMQTLDLREVESAKQKCAEKHFEAITTNQVKYGIVNTYEELYKIIKS